MLSPAALYPEMTERAARLAGPVLELLTGSAGADLVHCAAETDRTGVVVAVPLRAAGVRRDAVVGDYRRTTAAMAAVLPGRCVTLPSAAPVAQPDRARDF